MKLSYLTFLAAAAAMISTSAHGQILWSTPVEIENDGGESDVQNNGSYVDAFQGLPSGNNGINKPTLTVNGVKFNSDDFSLTDGVITYSGPLGGGSDGANQNISANYSSVLAGCIYVDDNPGDYNNGVFPNGVTPTGVIQIKVTPGLEYQVQLWNAYRYGSRSTIFSSGGTSSMVLTGGQYVLGDFLATSSTETIDFNGTTANGGSGVGELNAISVRLVPEPSTYAMIFAGLVVFGLGGRCLRRV